MERTNTIVKMANNSNQSQQVSKNEKCLLVQSVENRYGVNFLQGMYIVKENYHGYGHTPDWFDFKFKYYFKKHDMSGVKPEYYLTDLNFGTLEELFRLTNTMDFSNHNQVNNIFWNQNSTMVYLIPVIQIKYKKRKLGFRIDNEVITEMFEDTQAILSGNLSQEELINIDERLKHHMEYLDYTYSDTEYHTGCRNWEQLYWEKYYLGKNEMLHSEYLEWKTKLGI